jgi:hypothetical protein
MNKVNDYGFKTGDGLRQSQAFSKSASSESKMKLFKEAFKLVDSLLKDAFGSIEASMKEEQLVEVNPGVYSGPISVSATITTSSGKKTVPIVVFAEKSVVEVKDPENLTKVVSEKLNSLEGSLDKILKQKEARIEEKLDAINKKVAEDREIADRVLKGENLGKVTEEVRMGFTKKAKEYTYSDGLGGVIDRSLNETPLVIHYPKANLPSSIKEKDIINLNGVRYAVQGSSPALSAGKDDGHAWVLRLITD